MYDLEYKLMKARREYKKKRRRAIGKFISRLLTIALLWWWLGDDVKDFFKDSSDSGVGQTIGKTIREAEDSRIFKSLIGAVDSLKTGIQEGYNDTVPTVQTNLSEEEEDNEFVFSY